MFCKASVVIGVYDGEFTFCEWNFAKGAAEADATIPKPNEDKQIFNP